MCISACINTRFPILTHGHIWLGMCIHAEPLCEAVRAEAPSVVRGPSFRRIYSKDNIKGYPLGDKASDDDDKLMIYNSEQVSVYRVHVVPVMEPVTMANEIAEARK